MLDRRPFWILIIWLCVVIWIVNVQEQDQEPQPLMPEMVDAADAASVTATDALNTPLAGALATSSHQASGHNSNSHKQKHKRNQIHDPSRTQLSKLSFNDSQILVSLDKVATPAPPALAPTSASLSPMQADERQLIDLHNFAYLMTQPSCGAHIQALILVHTAPRNTEKRALIRQTWGSGPLTGAHSPLRLVFLLGAVLPNEVELQQALESENARYRDMLQGNFQDAYRNMTYKHVMALKWFRTNCGHAQLLLKVDDDVYVNTPTLFKYMQQGVSGAGVAATAMSTSTSAPVSQPMPEPAASASSSIENGTSLAMLLQQPHDLLFCVQFVGSRVKRSWRSKWRVSFSEYPERFYPPYCPGFAIVYSSDVVQRLYEAAQQTRYFWVDDVHITGVLAQRTHTLITTLEPFVLYANACERLLTHQTDLDQSEFLVSWHSISPQQISALWQLYTSQNYTLNGSTPSEHSRTGSMADTELAS